MLGYEVGEAGGEHGYPARQEIMERGRDLFETCKPVQDVMRIDPLHCCHVRFFGVADDDSQGVVVRCRSGGLLQLHGRNLSLTLYPL